MQNPSSHVIADAREQEPRADAYILHLPGVTPGGLGPNRFGRVLAAIRLAATRYAPEAHTIEASYDPATHERTGYSISLPDKLTAARVRLAVEAAMAGRPMPWVKP